jgi:kumamolisin
VGYLNPLLYGSLAGTGALVDITQGNNKVSGNPGYTAGTGWDACTGLGRPDGAKLLAALTAPPAPSPTKPAR